jgi:Tol biopolymer transport system component
MFGRICRMAVVALVLTATWVVVPPGGVPDASATSSSTGFVAVSPCRIADTRLVGGALTGTVRTFTVTGTGPASQGGNPAGCGIPSSAIAAVLSLSAVAPSGPGYLRAWPADEPPPTATVLNFGTARNVTNTAEIDLSASGEVSVRNFDAWTHLVIDVTGYFAPTPGAGLHPVTPCRIADTRLVGGALTGAVRTFTVTGTGPASQGGNPGGCGIPASATAVVVSLSAVAPSGPGYLRAWPADEAPPTATLVNYWGGQGVTNTTTVKLSASDQITVRNFTSGAHLVIDVTGYYEPSGFRFVSTTPCRLVDSRAVGGLLTGADRTFGTLGRSPASQGGAVTGCRVPYGAQAAVVSLSAVAPGGSGYLRVRPADNPPPTATVLNFGAGQSMTNTAIIQVSDAGELTARNFDAATHLVVDITGYFVDTDVTTSRASVPAGGGVIAGESLEPSMSADGRYVAFASLASNVVPGDTNGAYDVFVRDRATGTTERVSVATGGAEASADSRQPRISADGRYVAFASFAPDLVPGDTNGVRDVFVHDRVNDTTVRVSLVTGGSQANGHSSRPTISGDGDRVAFQSTATNLVPGDANGQPDVFVHDLSSGVTELVSASTALLPSNGPSEEPMISGDGTRVAFQSGGTDLVVGDTNGFVDVFVRDVEADSTERVSVATGGGQGNGPSITPSIDHTGTRIVFGSLADNLVSGDTNSSSDVFLRDTATATTTRVSVTDGGEEGLGASLTPSISADGSVVGFESYASNLVPGDTNSAIDVFVRDLAANTTSRVSISDILGESVSGATTVVLSETGQWAAFLSPGSEFDPSDTNTLRDVFVRGLIGL